MEPLENEIITSSTSTSGVPTPLIGSAQHVSEVGKIHKKASKSSINGMSLDNKSNNKVSTSLQSLNGNFFLVLEFFSWL